MRNKALTAIGIGLWITLAVASRGTVCFGLVRHGLARLARFVGARLGLVRQGRARYG